MLFYDLYTAPSTRNTGICRLPTCIDIISILAVIWSGWWTASRSINRTGQPLSSKVTLKLPTVRRRFFRDRALA